MVSKIVRQVCEAITVHVGPVFKVEELVKAERQFFKINTCGLDLSPPKRCIKHNLRFSPDLIRVSEADCIGES